MEQFTNSGSGKTFLNIQEFNNTLRIIEEFSINVLFGEVKTKPSNKKKIIILKDNSKPVTSYDPEGAGEADDN